MAENCKRCGNSLAISHQTQSLEQPVNNSLQNYTEQKLSTVCPKCSSNDTQSYPMAYQAGTSFGKIKTASYTFNVGATVTGGKISNQTILASKLNPPSQSFQGGLLSLFFFVFVGFIVYAIFSPILYILGIVLGFGAFVFCVCCVCYLINTSQKPNQVEISQWGKSWICLRCGANWII